MWHVSVPGQPPVGGTPVEHPGMQPDAVTGAPTHGMTSSKRDRQLVRDDHQRKKMSRSGSFESRSLLWSWESSYRPVQALVVSAER